MLIVDDEIDLLDCLSEDFSLLDCVVFQAANGLEGLEILKTQSVDLVLTDIDMPLKNGLDLLREFRLHDRKTPVVVMTGGSRYKDSDILALGATAVLHKPLPRIQTILDMIPES